MAIAVWNVRLPRIPLAFLVGCGLSAAGTAYQTVFQNPMAAPDILGASSGAVRCGAGDPDGPEHRDGHRFRLPGQPAVRGPGLSGGPPIPGQPCGEPSAGRYHGRRAVLGLYLLYQAGGRSHHQLPQITYWLMGSLSGTRMHTVAFAAVCMAAGLTPLLLLRWRMNRGPSRRMKPAPWASTRTACVWR